MNYRIDNLQYCNWTRQVFKINREASLDAVHVTIVYHEDFSELNEQVKKWQKLFHENCCDLYNLLILHLWPILKFFHQIYLY